MVSRDTGLRNGYGSRWQAFGTATARSCALVRSLVRSQWKDLTGFFPVVGLASYAQLHLSSGPYGPFPPHPILSSSSVYRKLIGEFVVKLEVLRVESQRPAIPPPVMLWLLST